MLAATMAEEKEEEKKKFGKELAERVRVGGYEKEKKGLARYLGKKVK